MRKHDAHLAFIIALFAIFSAGCAVTPTTPPDIATPVTAEAPVTPPTKIHSWQDDYAKLLRTSDKDQFYLCDINNDGIYEILIGGVMANWGKYSEYDVYTYSDNAPVPIGDVTSTSLLK